MFIFSAIFSHKSPSKSELPQDEAQNIKPEIKGYMFIFEASPNKQLDINAYLDGKKDDVMKNRAERIWNSRIVTCPIFNTINELIESKIKNGFTHLNGSCYILGVTRDPEEVYKLMKDGKFHEAIGYSENFHEACRDYQERTKSNNSTVTNR